MNFLEVTDGFEPTLEVLQTCALPLGYVTRYLKMTPSRFELLLPPWKGDVLTAWPRGLISHLTAIATTENLSAPQVGLEPTTSRLTAVRSTIELLRNIICSFKTEHCNLNFKTSS